MTPFEQIRQAMVREWLKKADEDLAVAEYLVSSDRPYFGAVGFHAQQATEKYLKAFLVCHQVEFPKTHDLDELLDLAAKVADPLVDSLREVSVLSVYGVETRYPTDLPDLDLFQAKTALNLATRARDAVRGAING
jgi:HEPN domain-containing protein